MISEREGPSSQTLEAEAGVRLRWHRLLSPGRQRPLSPCWPLSGSVGPSAGVSRGGEGGGVRGGEAKCEGQRKGDLWALVPMVMPPLQTSPGSSWAFYLRGLMIPEGFCLAAERPGKKNASSASWLLHLPEPGSLQKQDTQVTKQLR